MPDPNSMNTGKGKDFQRIAAKLLSRYFKIDFQIEYSIPIGNPPKDHRFDLVSENRMYIGECKNYSWTEGGNVPSAKMAFVNEAVFYLQHLSTDKKKFVVMRRDFDKKRAETLSDYYYRTYKHLLDDVFIIEIDVLSESIRLLEKG